MLQELRKPHIHLGSFLLRLGLAGIFIVHGILKFASQHGSAWHDDLTEASQIAITWTELVCGFALFLGLLSRLAALGTIVIQVGAIVLETAHWGFIHIEYNRADPSRIPTGAEYNFALIMMALAVIAIGSGKVSLDYFIFGSNEPTTPAR